MADTNPKPMSSADHYARGLRWLAVAEAQPTSQDAGGLAAIAAAHFAAGLLQNRIGLSPGVAEVVGSYDSVDEARVAARHERDRAATRAQLGLDNQPGAMVAPPLH